MEPQFQLIASEIGNGRIFATAEFEDVETLELLAQTWFAFQIDFQPAKPLLFTVAGDLTRQHTDPEGAIMQSFHDANRAGPCQITLRDGCFTIDATAPIWAQR